MQIKEIVQVFLSLIISASSIIWWKLGVFFVKFFLLQSLKIIKVCRSCIWLCDFMFCDTCILFFEIFISKVLRLRFFYYKIMIFLKMFFGLGLEFETDQASQPSAPPCPFNLAQKDKEWTKVGSKWKWKLALALSHILPNSC